MQVYVLTVYDEPVGIWKRKEDADACWKSCSWPEGYKIVKRDLM